MLNRLLGPDINSIVYFVCGIFIPILTWCYLSTEYKEEANHQDGEFIYFKWGFTFLLLLLTQHYMEQVIEAQPLDYTHADMLPIMEIMSKRWLAGTDPYNIIMEIWGGMQPIYLPAMWLPFTIPSILGLDMRWATWAIIFLGTLTIIRPWSKEPIHFNSFALLTAIVLYLWVNILQIDTGMLALTEEGIVIGYYLMLCLALHRKNAWLIGITAALCIMSRYSLLPWCMIMIVLLFIIGNRILVYKIAASCIVTSILLMTIGNAWGSIDIFLSVPDNYLSAIIENRNKYEGMIKTNLGIAKFWKYESLASLHTLLKCISVIAPMSCAIIYYWNRKIKWHLLALISLKISLVLFYNLLIMPYSYLFYTSTAVSLFLLRTTFSSKKSEIVLT